LELVVEAAHPRADSAESVDVVAQSPGVEQAEKLAIELFRALAA
jgi:hypothetical protein